MQFRKRPKRVAAMNLDLRAAGANGLAFRGSKRKRQALSRVNDIRICDPEVGGGQFRPARSFAEIFRSQLPE